MFDQTIERGTQGYDQRKIDLRIQRTGGETVVVGFKRDGAPGAYEDHIVGADWSIRRLLNGREAPTAKPFQFPMTVGQTWTVDFTDPTPRGAQSSLHVHRVYKVVDVEAVTVPAGTFQAYKVEATGVDQGTMVIPNAVTGAAVTYPGGGQTSTRSQLGGRKTININAHAELYYVPSVKNYVKSVEEQFNTDDVLVRRETRVLVSFQPTG